MRQLRASRVRLPRRMRLPLWERLLTLGWWPPWSGDSEPDDDAQSASWQPEAAGPEHNMFADAAAEERDSARSGDMIITEGAARAIEQGARVEALKLTLF